jgi:hypothetical protein
MTRYSIGLLLLIVVVDDDDDHDDCNNKTVNLRFLEVAKFTVLQ